MLARAVTSGRPPASLMSSGIRIPPTMTGSIHSMERTEGRDPATLAPATRETRSRSSGQERPAGVDPADRVGNASDVLPDAVEPRRVQVDDRDVLAREARDRRLHVVERDRADVAQVLRDDHVVSRRAKRVHPDLVDGQSVGNDVPHRLVDGAARGERADPRARQDRQRLHPAGVVASAIARRAPRAPPAHRRFRWRTEASEAIRTDEKIHVEPRPKSDAVCPGIEALRYSHSVRMSSLGLVA